MDQSYEKYHENFESGFKYKRGRNGTQTIYYTVSYGSKYANILWGKKPISAYKKFMCSTLLCDEKRGIICILTNRKLPSDLQRANKFTCYQYHCVLTSSN